MDMDRRWEAHGSLAVVQLLLGGFQVLSKFALNVGVNEIIFCCYRCLFAISTLVPAALLFDRNMFLSVRQNLLMSLLFLGLTGVFGAQLLFITGLSYTSSTWAAATLPSIPVFAFLLSVILGTERVNLLKKEGLAKVGGTLTCVSGAILMLLYKGPPVIGVGHGDTVAQSKDFGYSENTEYLASSFMENGIWRWYIGTLCLFGTCMCMATYHVFLASVVRKYPSSLSVTAYSQLFGAAFMFLTGLFTTNSLQDWILREAELVAVLYAGIIASATCFGLSAWSNKILGPVLVTLYIPLQPIAVDILSRIFLGSSIHLGSIIGGLLIIAGLYLVTWASYRERHENANVSYPNQCSEPLLSDA